VEFAATIPARLQRRGGSKKHLLKRLLRTRFGFGEEFLRRGKQGFDLPIGRWFKGELEEYARRNLLRPDAMIARYLNQDYVRTLIEKHRRRSGIYANLIWSILVFEHWLRAWHGDS
jgi:asparagine synthase (glutamine-hydrolysing)